MLALKIGTTPPPPPSFTCVPPQGPTTPVGIAFNESQIIVVDGENGYLFDYNLVNSTNSATKIAGLVTETLILTNICLSTGNN